MRVVVTRIAQDGAMQRRIVDTAWFDDSLQWDRFAASAVEFPPPYRPVPGVPIYHVSVGDVVVLVAEYDLGGPLLNLVTAVMARGEELLARLSALHPGVTSELEPAGTEPGHASYSPMVL